MFRFLLSFFIVHVAFTREIPHNSQESNKKLVIDHDGGADDAMAIFMALLCEKYLNGPQLVGLTTVHGNVYENQTYINTQRILDVAKRPDVHIFRGSQTPYLHLYPQDNFFGIDGLGDNETVEFKSIKAEKEHAVMALLDLSIQYEGDLVVLTIGSLTNVALAIQLDPDFLSRLSHIYVAAGNIFGDNYEEGEFNALMDVEAYRILSDNAILDKVTVIPFSEIRKDCNIDMLWRTEVLGAIDTKIMKAQNVFEQIANYNTTKWEFLDPLAMAVVLNPSVVVESVPTKNSILLTGESRGVNTNIFNSQSSNVNLITKISYEEIKSYLLKVFSAEL